ncbi:MAG: hypothetical protein LUD17_15770 [Bacteroidales bacterium]|nr:hypothetical protein [Bacteroidales bacterium]
MQPKFLGSEELLKRKEMIGFFCSRHTLPASVMPTLDWAYEVRKREDTVVISGFQSDMEREVLDILLGGKCGIVIVLNRSIYKVVPEAYASAFADGRLLFISLLGDGITRPSRQNAERRNRYIAECATSLVFSSVTPESSLYPLMAEYELRKEVRRK